MQVRANPSHLKTLLHACAAPVVSESGEAFSVPRLSSSLLLPNPSSHAGALLPDKVWRGESRDMLLAALHPIAVRHTEVKKLLVESDWFLTALIHPSALPRGPLRTTFAMPSDLASHGVPWISLSFEMARRVSPSRAVPPMDAALLQWMRKSPAMMEVERKFVFSKSLVSTAPDVKPAAPNEVVVAGAICLIGAVLRSGGRNAAGALMDEVLRVAV